MTPAKPRFKVGWSTIGKYLFGLMPFLLVWLALVFWLTSLLSSRAKWSEESDEAVIREWLDETRVFRKTLPELVREYGRLRAENADESQIQKKRSELEEQLRSLAEPTRAYDNKLPGFPVIYRLEVTITNVGETVAWVNPLPRPRQQNQSQIRSLEYAPGTEARIRCEYQLHAFNQLQQREYERQRESWIAGVVLVTATLLAGVFVYRFLRRELRRETDQLRSQAEAEHRERELLENRIAREEAEKSALELKSQLYAGIGILAGSYAHNIKNLLVRPNDLLRRCMDADGITPMQAEMLTEVQSTLGTVTERLQQILRTVRRDPNQTTTTRVDLSQLIRETARTWTDTAREKWKLDITASVPKEPLWITGDLSHLHQTVENLLFNARDATFEMRNHLREQARTDNTAERKQKLLDASAWRGAVSIGVHRTADRIVLEVRDNGIGMTDEVRQNCLRTHFTTKRDNALYEGYSAGMGLGLSFVAMVVELHQATLEIESTPLSGALFQIYFSEVRS